MHATNGFRYIGHGVYTIAEASRLTRVPAGRIRRWLLGYRYPVGTQLHDAPPVVARDYQGEPGLYALSFLDLQEIRFVHAFRCRGVGWPVIRVTHEKARALLEDPHPFSTGRFLTDGRNLLLKHASRGGDLLDVISSQLAFRRIIAPFLKELDFEGDRAARWWPSVGRRRVVLDPQRSFGQPIVHAVSVPTTVLARAHAIEQSYDRVARWYDVPRSAVRAAVDFEKFLAAA